MHTLIRASAGTGKTWQLSGHFMRQLFEGTQPETVLATTFTRKAAGEILGRVLLRLAEAAEDPQACEQLAESMQPLDVTADRATDLLHDLTRQLHRMRVSTLDSFFQQIARSLTLELGLSPGWTIVDDYADGVLRRQAVEAVLAEQDVRDARQLMQMLAKGRSRRSVRSLIDSAVDGYYEAFLQSKSAAWDRIPQKKGIDPDQRLTARSNLMSVELSGKRLPETRIKDLDRFDAEQWTEFLDKGVSGKIARGLEKFGNQKIPPELADGYEPLVEHARAMLLNEFARRNLAARELIRRFDHAYRQQRQETGFTRFNEVTRLLSGSTDTVSGRLVNYRLDSTLRHLLLDEFQDTSLDQWNVLRQLVAPLTGEPRDGSSSVFCVGDSKQAIYGWRGGIAEIMDELQAAVPGIHARDLYESRRSSPAVIDTVNHVFRNLRQHSNLKEYESAVHAWSDSFPPHTTFRKGLPGFAELRTSPEFAADYDTDAKSAYTTWVAQHVAELHQKTPSAEIGVLMRTNKGVARIVHQLTSLGIPASEEGGTPPTDSAVVLAMMSLLHLASHPGCMVSRYHVALSPLGPLFDLTHWQDAAAAHRTSLAVRNQLLDVGYGDMLQWLADEMQAHCSARDQVRLQQIVAEGRRFDQMPSLNPADFVVLLENARFSRSASAPVRVMTVHQSKGLEFDVVVAPELNVSLMHSPDLATGRQTATAPLDDICIWLDKDLRYLLPERVQRAFQQTIADGVRGSLCLLYVTLTRAIHALHILVPADTKKKTRSLAGLVTTTMSEDEQLEENAQIWSTGDPLWHEKTDLVSRPRISGKTAERPIPTIALAPLDGGRQRGLSRRSPSQHAATQLPFGQISKTAAESFEFVDGRARGTLVHAWFECINWLEENTVPTRDMLREIAMRTELSGAGLREASVDTLIDEFFEMLTLAATRNTLSAADAFQRLIPSLSPHERTDVELRVHVERPFVFRHEGEIVHGIIDRLVVAEKDGQPIAAEVVDFKTDRLTGHEKDWIAMKVNDYGDQLRDYQRAVMKSCGLSADAVRLSLLLLDIGVLVEVSG